MQVFTWTAVLAAAGPAVSSVQAGDLRWYHPPGVLLDIGISKAITLFGRKTSAVILLLVVHSSRRNMKPRFAAFAATLLLGSVLIPSAALAQNELNHGPSSDIRPDGRGNRTRQSPPRNVNGQSGGAVVTGNGISYHNGPVMHGTVNMYYIWYGDWSQDSKADAILTDWGNNISGSPYENINTTYGDTSGNVSGAIALAGSTQMSSTTFGTSLSDSSIASIVSRALTTGALPTDSNGVYFVLTAPYISETSGFLSQYCGWHTYGNINGANIKYAFVGNAAASLGSCAWQTGNSPNGDAAADGMVSVMAHELEEAASDPNLNAWYDSTGAENADKCAWTFGTTYSSGGGIANMRLGSRDYLIQQNWVNASGGYCALSYTSTADFSLSVSPSSQSVPSSGGPAVYNITETPLNGFTENVTYTQSGLASGWVTISGTVLTATVPAGTTAGTYPFTITGASSTLAHSVSASLVVSAPPQPSFTISISPASQSVNRGGSVPYTVTITPVSGFTGSVALSPSGSKTGLVLTLPQSVAITSSSVTVTLTATTSPSAKKGNDTFAVTGTYTGTGGPITKSVNASLRIN